MTLHIKLGRFDWEKDRTEAMEESNRQRYGHSVRRMTHSGLTIKGKFRKLFNIKK